MSLLMCDMSEKKARVVILKFLQEQLKINELKIRGRNYH